MMESLSLDFLGRKEHQWCCWLGEHSTLNDHVLRRQLTIANSFYEGYNMGIVTYATRVCKLMGVQVMIGGSIPNHIYALA
jgi:hypothetical protein